MALFRKRTPKPTPVKKASKPASSEQTDGIDKFHGDSELRAVDKSIAAGDWGPANKLLDSRGHDGWSLPALARDLTLDQAATGLEKDNKTARSVAAMGHGLINGAWKLRGSGAGSTVSNGAISDFHKLLLAARMLLKEAIELDDTHVFARTGLLTIGMGLNQPHEELQTTYDEIHDRDPFYAPAVWAMTNLLSQKWGGAEGQALEFARWVTAEAPAGHPAKASLPQALHDDAFIKAISVSPRRAEFLKAYAGGIDRHASELHTSLTSFLDGLPNEVAPPSHVRALNWYFYVISPIDSSGDNIIPRLLKAIDNRPSDYPWGTLIGKPAAVAFQERQQRAINLARAQQQMAATVAAELAKVKA